MRRMSPLDSLTACRLGNSLASSSSCSGSTSVPYAGGLLYSMQPSGVAANTRAKCVRVSRQSPTYAYGGSTINPRHPHVCAAWAISTASRVPHAPTAATTGNASPSTSTARVHSERFSSRESSPPSPSEPGVTNALHPCPAIQAMCRPKRSRSMDSSALNGVVIAGKTPFQSARCMGLDDVGISVIVMSGQSAHSGRNNAVSIWIGGME